MINVSAKTIEGAVYKAYLELYTSKAVVSDPSILKEDSAVIIITNEVQPTAYFKIVNGNLVYTFDHASFVPSVKQVKLKDEEKYWTQVLLKTNAKDKIVAHLRKNMNSRRTLLDLWKDEYFYNTNQGGACITQLYFRKKGEGIELHTHARANDAHRCLLMDLHMMSTMHVWVAKDLGLNIGQYIHFVDALHFYKKYEQDIHEQVRLFNTLYRWKKYRESD